ncbi:hypothetical protein [Streptomyces sp. NPDC051561]|uniref:hypothetical protein n=1 Tax=Streptomyces sp. NPDC051561 TaxID=3365658 RepID=UPI003797A323
MKFASGPERHTVRLRADLAALGWAVSVVEPVAPSTTVRVEAVHPGGAVIVLLTRPTIRPPAPVRWKTKNVRISCRTARGATWYRLPNTTWTLRFAAEPDMVLPPESGAYPVHGPTAATRRASRPIAPTCPCDKVAFPSQERAVVALGDVQRKRLATTGHITERRVYLCPDVPGIWHMTSKKGGGRSP